MYSLHDIFYWTIFSSYFSPLAIKAWIVPKRKTLISSLKCIKILNVYFLWYINKSFHVSYSRAAVFYNLCNTYIFCVAVFYNLCIIHIYFVWQYFTIYVIQIYFVWQYFTIYVIQIYLCGSTLQFMLYIYILCGSILQFM